VRAGKIRDAYHVTLSLHILSVIYISRVQANNLKTIYSLTAQLVFIPTPGVPQVLAKQSLSTCTLLPSFAAWLRSFVPSLSVTNIINQPLPTIIFTRCIILPRALKVLFDRPLRRNGLEGVTALWDWKSDLAASCREKPKAYCPRLRILTVACC